MTLDEARRALFAASRELSNAHAYRMRSTKSDMAAVQACRDADRELQRAAVDYTVALIRSMPEGPKEVVADLVSGVKEFIK